VIDKYGRKLKQEKNKEDLKRYYHLEKEVEVEEKGIDNNDINLRSEGGECAEIFENETEISFSTEEESDSSEDMEEILDYESTLVRKITYFGSSLY
jgi:hypothetical protein